MRRASINLLFDQFVSITSGMLTEDQCKEVFLRASRFRPTRILIKANKVKSTQISQVLRPCNEQLFNNILSALRLEAHHRFMPLVPADSEWKMMMAIAADAEDYCTLFQFSQTQGYTEYIKAGMKMMGKLYSLSKFKYYKEKIFSLREKMETVSNDPDPELTAKVYKTYLRMSGIKHNEKFYAENVAHLVYICDRIRETGIRYDRYVEAQFEYWKGFNKVPEVSWLHTDEAVKRTFKIK